MLLVSGLFAAIGYTVSMESAADTRPSGPRTRLTPRQEKRNADRLTKKQGRAAEPQVHQPLPRWVSARPGGLTLPDAAFAAGAAVFALDHLLRADPPWHSALRLRRALKATATAARLLRLNADEPALRDAEHLTRPGDDPGPAGRLHRLFRQLASQPLRSAQATLEKVRDEIGNAAAASQIMALLRADMVLAERLGWSMPLLLHLPVILDATLRQGDSGKCPDADSAAWSDQQHGVLAQAVVAAHAEAMVLQRKTVALAASAGALRTRGGSAGVALILADDAVAPWKMIGNRGLGSDRAARRFCETLAGQGALRLLTDRSTFRLYGL
jgi:hypothetical protein